MASVVIVGAGRMGTAMAWPLRDNGHQVRLVGTPLDDSIIHEIRTTRVHPHHARKIPDGVEPFSHTELHRALYQADVVISGVSSFGVRWFADAIGPLLPTSVPVLAVTKGLEDLPNGDLRTLLDATDTRLPPAIRHRISLNAVAGPCIAQELAARRHSCVVFCGRDRRVLAGLRGLLGTSYYHISLSTDVIGVEVCAALKNAYALAVGIALGVMDRAGPDGLAHMYNPQAAVVGQACREMRLLVSAFGGRPEQAAWLPGAGDLFVTILGGRTVRLGRRLGEGRSIADALQEMRGETLESVQIITVMARALPKLTARGVVPAGGFPLMERLGDIVVNGAPPDFPWGRFPTDETAVAP